MRKLIFAITVMMVSLFAGNLAHARDVNIAHVFGYETKPELVTTDYTLSLNHKVTNTHSVGGFGKYRYSETDNHAYQGLLGIFVNRTINNISSVNSSYAFVQTYGTTKFDTDRFSFSYNRTYHETKQTSLKMTASYSTQTDFTEGQQVSLKNTLLVKTPNKKLTMTFADTVSYNFDADKINLNKLDWQIRYGTGKKTSVTAKYSNLSYSFPRTDSDDVINVQFTVSM